MRKTDKYLRANDTVFSADRAQVYCPTRYCLLQKTGSQENYGKTKNIRQGANKKVLLMEEIENWVIQ